MEDHEELENLLEFRSTGWHNEIGCVLVCLFVAGCGLAALAALF